MEKLIKPKDLFGATRRIEATGDHRPDIERLLRPFEGKDSVAYFFCKGCGLTFEVNERVAAEEVKKTGQELPVDLSNFYFESDGCEACDGDEGAVELKTIMQ